ncbi:hypothetical protein COCON_G00003100 [Conger conger]|uniref:Ig-like domain-containing protein n=1 Tax=Conger conger TaxID=82655 RepID=A0A9Q1E0Z7_CONCO|nr:hypothetical protein COCON_G00003100 [Conger conger]
MSSVFTHLRNMDTQARLWVFCLYLQALCAPGISDEWEADIVPKLKAMTDSCVVIPCVFKYPGTQKSEDQLRAIWYKKKDTKALIYDEDQSKVDNAYKRRTKLLGKLGKLNCSLEIDDIKSYDNEEFCFRTEIPNFDQYSFKESCVLISTFEDASKPKLSHHQEPVEGSPFTVICSVIHTCPSHFPTLTWSHGTQDKIITEHKDMGHGQWESQSILTFIPTQEDDHGEVSCTVTYYGRDPMKEAIKLNMKRKFSMLYIIIPVTAAVGTAVVFGALCILMRKKYKNRIEALQRGGDHGLWNRLSRLTRRRHPGDYHDGASRPERRSIWSRFSRRPHGNNADVGYRANNEVTSVGGAHFSKPRCPSPKSNPRSSCGANSGNNYSNNSNDNCADASIYGNV